MNDDFVVLHLSDAHLGNPKHHPDSFSVLRPLLDDLEIGSRNVGTPNLVIFSGDLAYGQIPEVSLEEQYKQAFEWLTSIYNALGTTFDITPLVLVPGNHDLDDNKVGRDQVEWVKRLEGIEGAEEVRSFMQKGEVDWKRYLERQAKWVDFFRLIRSPWNFDENLNLVTGIITHGNIKIGIAGLNSSWASSPQPKLDHTNGRLWIGKHQLQLAIDRIEQSDFKIAVAHHPPSWLNPGERNWISDKIESKFHMFLHGHEHHQWFREQPKHVVVEAGACYERSDKENGYSWIKLNFRKRTAQIYLREYSDSGEGGWGPRKIHGKTDIDGKAEIKLPSKDEPKNPNVRKTTTKKTLNKKLSAAKKSEFPDNVRDYSAVLINRFGFRWETSSFQPSAPNPLVYWPIRLRHPTPIHAVQCFAAAGLQRCGCEIVLCVDDLGHKDYSVEEFRKTIQRWFSRAGGDDSALIIRECSEILASDNAGDIWTQVKQWLGETTYLLEKVLRVSKLLPMQEEVAVTLEELVKQRPRRLLTPAVVWTCLLYLHRVNETRPIITLAGYDEKPLWQAWRDCSNEREIKVGHLYAPELNQSDSSRGVRPIHMSTTDDLEWESKEDIGNVLKKEFSTVQSTSDWLNAHRLIPWCLRECVLLPAWLTSSEMTLVVNGKNVMQVEDLGSTEPSTLIPALVDALDRWLL